MTVRHTKEARDLAVDLSPPAHLTGEAAVIWRQTVAAMSVAETLDEASLALFERRAVRHVRSRAAEARIAAEGEVVTASQSGVAMVSPWLGIARTAAAQLGRIEAELGVSPLRRGRVGRVLRSVRAPTALDELRRRGRPCDGRSSRRRS